MKSINQLMKLYEIGTPFIITGSPRQWSSALNNNSPMHSDIKYPYHGKIVNITYHSSSNHIAIDDGIYGWALTILIKKNLIINIKEQRKLKLEKIKHYDEKR